MRVTRRQLRALVRESMRRPLHEVMSDAFVDEIADFISSMAVHFHDIYDDDDPSMGPLGRDAWSDQVDDALADLDMEVGSVVDDVYNRLTNGDYYTGDGPMGEVDDQGLDSDDDGDPREGLPPGI